jgi:hypothetical protein
MPSTPKHGRTLSRTLKRLLRGGSSDRLKLGDVIDEIEDEEGPGPVLFVLTLPVLLPTPPGVSMVLALPLLIVAPQIIVGRRKLWMPHALAERTIERKALDKLVPRVLPPLRRLERLVRPRLQVLTGRIGASLVGVAATVIAIVLVLPIPAANLVPSLALVLFALGLSRRDGLFVLAGYGLLALAAVVIWLAVAGFRFGLGHLKL